MLQTGTDFSPPPHEGWEEVQGQTCPSEWLQFFECFGDLAGVAQQLPCVFDHNMSWVFPDFWVLLMLVNFEE